MDNMQAVLVPYLIILIVLGVIIWFIYFVASNRSRWKKIAKKTNLVYIGTKQNPVPSEIENAVKVNGYVVINAKLLLQGNRDGREWRVFNCFSHIFFRQDQFLPVVVISVSTKKSLPHCFIKKMDILDNVIDRLFQVNAEKIIDETIGDYKVTGINTSEYKLMISKIKTFLQENNMSCAIEIDRNLLTATITNRKMSFYKDFPDELNKIEKFVKIIDSN